MAIITTAYTHAQGRNGAKLVVQTQALKPQRSRLKAGWAGAEEK
jgi:hypothetical protein